MVAKLVMLISACWFILAGCEASGEKVCNHDKSVSITWHPPTRMDGIYSIKVFVSHDGLSWNKVMDETSRELNTNGVWTKADTCEATYWYAEMQDDHGLCSQEGSCIGKLCKSFSIPECAGS